MIILWNVVVIIIAFLPLGILIYKISKDVIDYIKVRKNLKESDRAIFEFLIVMFIAPLVIYQMDRYNLFSMFKLNSNISTNYDWLSFIGTYISSLISTMLLIYVTRKDRIDNNENVREAQRPCLCTKLYLPISIEKLETSLEGYIQQTNINSNTLGYYRIIITNFGQTVAIIDTEKSYIIAKKFKDEVIQVDKNMSRMETNLKEEKVYFNKYEDRLQINSNGSVEIIIEDDGMYRNIENEEKPAIKEVYIEYSDLFGKRYRDYIKIEYMKTKVIIDNEMIG